MTEFLRDEDEEDESELEDDGSKDEVAETTEGIEDRTETNLVNLQRVIYLTIMNALSSEEAVHKLLKVQTDKFQEIEMTRRRLHMVIECSSQERSYSTFYGLIGMVSASSVVSQQIISRRPLRTTTLCINNMNHLRNVGRFFWHLLTSIFCAVFERGDQ